MVYMYYCPKCQKMYSGEDETPSLTGKHCPECSAELKYAGITKNIWSTKTDVEKNRLLEEMRSKAASATPEITYLAEAQAHHLKTVDENISTIKNILVFFTVLWVISTIITIIALF